MNKRLIVLILSISTIVAYGYALGGLGSYAMGVPKPVPIAAGLSCGTVFAVAALRLWKSYLEELERERKALEAEEEQSEEENEITRKDVITNEVVLVGYICKKPIYRQTPFGREIADILLAVNRAYNKSDYIPCIAWGRNARFCQNLEVGAQIKLVGRVQSRTYEKKHEDGSVETRVAYEVSVGSLEVIEENDNENTIETENQEAV